MKRALLIEHDAWTRPGLIGDALAGCGYLLERRLVVPEDRFENPDVDHEFPDPGEFDLVVPMGAPWAADDHEVIGSWLAPELTFLRNAHERGVPVLGVCFGGQAMCVALGGGIRRDVGWEIGYRSIESTDDELVGPGPWFQFHHDAMQPPSGAVVLARNDFGVQAWRLERTLAVQFHPEVTPEILDLWLAHGGREVLADQDIDAAAIKGEMVDSRDHAAERTTELIRAFVTRIANGG